MVAVGDTRTFLRLLANIKSPSQRKELIKSADAKIIKAICECALNVLKCRVHVVPSQLKRLRRYKKVMRALAKPKTKLSLARKKALIVQNGGLLPALLIPILAALGKTAALGAAGAAGGVVAKKILD